MTDDRITDHGFPGIETELFASLSTVMAEPCRVRILSALATGDEPLSVDDLVSAITSFDFGTPPSPGLGTDPDDAAVSLHHCHLPSLDDHGLVRYDPERNRATLTSKGSRCLTVLELTGRDGPALGDHATSSG